ncbi:hypothetical protein [Thalassotalea sp. PS06]|uniref:hypothetical protein n=1 Tax=Thalassotalea sp. PS06 TaxID=2594005 RepID=UPI001163B573|nr:hypothetical protein [Thalassotalea sp. PS06]QDP00726.1 hypothetical protein FNC98_04775 [Thalassotalea sp. PS06]
MKIREYFQQDGISKIVMLFVALSLTALLVLFIVFNIRNTLAITFSYTLLLSSTALLAQGILFWFGYRYIWQTGN